MSGGRDQLGAELAAAGRWMASQGLLPATSGNLSARLSPTHALVTVSGGDKGALSDGDLLEVELAAPVPPRASAETALHLMLYRRPVAGAPLGAVLHGHSVASTVISRRRTAQLPLQGYELIKAFEGVRGHQAQVALAVIDNDQDLPALAAIVAARLAEPPERGQWAPGFLLAGHGLYAWGESVAAARRHLEALEFLLRCELEQLRVTR